MKIYAISGLGADERLFSRLELQHEIVFLDWQSIENCPDIKTYAKRFLVNIDTSTPFGLMGVSFGGMICSELSHLCSPQFVILISSAENRKELPKIYRMAGETDIVKLFPKSVIGSGRFAIPMAVLKKMFGSESALLEDYITNADADFGKWAAQLICKWENKKVISQPKLKIKGNKDLILPLTDNTMEIIKEAGHLMVYENAHEVSEIVNNWFLKQI